ncbi:MAG: DUF4870 domain-containing protein [Planctomycetota bacterium]
MSDQDPPPSPEETPAPPPEEPTAPPPPAEPPAEAVTAGEDDKNMGMLAHLLGAFTGFLGPLIIWLVKKDDSPFVDQEGKESLNFQITALIVYVALAPISVITCGFGAILYFPVFIAVFVLCIIAALKAKDGVAYRYPLTIRLLK